VLIIDPNGVARHVGPDLLREDAAFASAAPGRSSEPDAMALLVFRDGPTGLKAVPLSLVTRLEEIDAASIEHAGGTPCVQYRGRLMPLVTTGGGAVRSDGLQALIVFSEFGRSVALAVDEIVDIVEEVFDIEAVIGRPDLVGSAIIRGRATEIIDVVDLLPRSSDQGPFDGHVGPTRVSTILLVDDKVFFRDMLSPVLKAAGFRVKTATGAQDALDVLAGGSVDAVVTDLDMPGLSGLHLIEEMRRHPRTANLPVIALASAASPEALDRARGLSVFDVVAKFDRTGLVAALAEAGPLMGVAA
jgi:two-component system chemotaxis sensor kinase CheA